MSYNWAAEVACIDQKLRSKFPSKESLLEKELSDKYTDILKAKYPEAIDIYPIIQDWNSCGLSIPSIGYGMIVWFSETEYKIIPVDEI